MLATKTVLKILINTALGVVLIFIWLQFVDISEISQALATVELIDTLPVLFFFLLAPTIRAYRLKILLSKIKNIPLKNLIFLNGAAILFNFYIPIRAGEIIKGVYLNNQYGLPMSHAIVWIFLDRFIDFLIVLMLAPILLLIIPNNIPDQFIIVILSLLLIALFITYIFSFRADLAKKVAIYLRYLLINNNIKVYFDRFFNFLLQSFSLFKRSPYEISLLFLVTIFAYSADTAALYLSFGALGNAQNFLMVYLGQLISGLTYLIPAAPGYIGSAEASGLLVFAGIFGLDTNLVSATIVLYHLLAAISILIFGLISVYFLKIDLSQLLRRVFANQSANN